MDKTVEIGHQKDSIAKVLDRNWEACLSGQSGCLFINTQNSLTSSSFINDKIMKLPGDKVYIHKSIPKSTYLQPYYPLLDVIKDYLAGKNEQEIKSFIDESNTYSLHRNLLLNFFLNRPVIRDEDPILEEVVFEREKLKQCIYNMFLELGKEKPVVLFISELHNAGASTLDLLGYMIENTARCRVLLITSFNVNFRFLDEKTNDLWLHFIGYLEKKFSIFDLIITPQLAAVRPAPLAPVNQDLEKSLEIARNCLHLLAFSDCRNISESLYNTFSVNNNYDFQLGINTLVLLADACCYLEQNDTALVYFQTALHLCQEKELMAEAADLYRKMAFVYLKKNDFETAYLQGNQSLKLALDLKDDSLIRTAYVVITIITFKQPKCYGWAKHLENAAKSLSDFGFENTLSYLYSIIPLHFDIMAEKSLALQDNVIEIANKLGNDYRLANAHQNIAVIFSLVGDYQRSIANYKKAKNIRIKLGQKLELAEIYNGMGYSYFLNEMYDEAQKHYLKAMNILINVKDFSEVLMTCYNFAALYYFSFNFDQAIYYLENHLIIVNTLKFKHIRSHSLFGIYVFLGNNYISSGNFTRAVECLNKAEKYEVVNEEEQYYHEMLLALIAKEEHRYEDAVKHFQQAYEYMVIYRHHSDLKKLFPRYYYEYGKMEQKFGHIKVAKERFQAGLKCAEQINFKFYKQLLTQANTEFPVPSALTAKKRLVSFKSLLETAEQESKLNDLHKKVNEIHFINNLQKILGQKTEAQDLIDSVMRLINAHFFIKYGYLYLLEKEQWKPCYQVDPPEQFKDSFSKFLEWVFTVQKDLFLHDFSSHPSLLEQFPDLSSLIILQIANERKHFGVFLFFNEHKDIQFTFDNFRILSITAKQLAMALEKIYLHQELKELVQQLESLSLRDELTVLYNRRGFMTLAEQHFRIARRNSSSFLVLFIDIDNMKYINDRFGHSAGDDALVSMACALRSTFRDSDIVARLGGDEFVVLAVETRPEHMAFIEAKLQQHINEINQSEQTRPPLEFSLGFAHYNPSTKSIEAMLTQADAMMYRQKQAKKSPWRDNLKPSEP